MTCNHAAIGPCNLHWCGDVFLYQTGVYYNGHTYIKISTFATCTVWWWVILCSVLCMVIDVCVFVCVVCEVCLCACSPVCTWGKGTIKRKGQKEGY